jgi:magnesium transporter
MSAMMPVNTNETPILGDTVGPHALRDIPVGRLGDSVGALLARLGQRRYDLVDPVFLCDGAGRPAGACRLTDLLTAAPSQPIDGLARRDVPAAPESMDQEHAAALARKHRLTALPVVDGEGRLVGAVPPAALIDISRHEHAEDISRLAGILHQVDHARMAAEASPLRRLRDRLPWLFVGLAGSMIATGVMARFEHVLAGQVAVAFFIPAIVYLADAIGTQTEAVAVRALSLAHGPLARMLASEVATGMLIGGTLGIIAWLAVYGAFGDLRLASAVGAAILVAGAMATTCGLLLPWLLSRFGADPAFGSGPVATVIQDVLSLLIYFLIVIALFGF